MTTTTKPIDLSLADVLSALSYALDLTGGYRAGHAERTAAIANRLGVLCGLTAEQLTDLRYAVLMKDSGCSSNAARMYEIFGVDEIAIKRKIVVIDKTNLLEAARFVAGNIAPGKSLLSRARKLVDVAKNPGQFDEIIETRCSRGYHIALTLGLSEQSAQGVFSLTERWDGRGTPKGLTGDAIPILARIANAAQHIDLLSETYGIDTAFEIVRSRSGTTFDPGVIELLEPLRATAALWESPTCPLPRPLPEAGRGALDAEGLSTSTASAEPTPDRSSPPLPKREGEEFSELNANTARTGRDSAVGLAQGPVMRLGPDRIDAVCETFAQIVDAKSPYTAEHSRRVHDYAVIIAEGLGIVGDRMKVLRRAALLHDIGKLGVPNSILDKPGRLDASEWECVRRHPRYTHDILSRIPGFDRIAAIAGSHHERLDGSGYHMGVGADALDIDMRILAVADVYDALSAKRPYRDALSPTEVFALLDRDATVALDSSCIDILKGLAPTSD